MEKMFIYVLDQAVTVRVVILVAACTALDCVRIVGGGGDTASRSGFDRESV